MLEKWMCGRTQCCASLLEFDHICLTDEHPNQGYGAGPNIFSSDAVILSLFLSVLLFQ